MKAFRIFLTFLFLTVFTITGISSVWATSFSDGWRDQLKWVKKTSAYTAHPGDNILLDTTAAGVTITLPSTAKFGDEIRISDSDATFDTNNCTVARNGHNIRAAASDLTLSGENQYIHLFYIDATVGWAYTTSGAVAAGTLTKLTVVPSATEAIAIDLQGATNDYTGADTLFGMKIARDYNRGTGTINNAAGWQSYLTPKHTDGVIAGDYFSYGAITRVGSTGKITNTGAADRQYWEVGTHSTSKVEGDFDTDSTGKLNTKFIGSYNWVWAENYDVLDTGANTPANVFEAVGTYSMIEHLPDLNAPASATFNSYGFYADLTGNTEGTSTGYGYYIEDVDGFDTNWGFYCASADPSYLGGALETAGTLTTPKITIVNTAEPAITISQTGITGTDNQAIDITGGEALASQEHYTGIRVKPDDLDPAGADTRIRGVAINVGGVDTTNVPESLEALRLVTPSGLTGAARDATDALRIIEGDINQTATIPATAAETFTMYDMTVDISSLHTNSEVHGLNLSTAGGVPDGEVVAIGTHSYVAPVHQHIGSYTTPSQTEYAGRKTGGGATWADGVDTIEIFIVNSDEVYIGSAATFSEIEIIMTTPGTKTVTPTFWYNTAADTWTQFFPEDATIGFTQSGLIHWPLGDISGSWTNDGDPGAGDTSAGYWIKIIRTAAPDPGAPTPTTVKSGTVTVYKWDEDGNLTINSLVSMKDYTTLYAEEGLDHGTTPPEAATVLTSTNRVVVRNFAGATANEILFFLWQPPYDLTGGTIQFRPICFVTNGTAPADTETVIFTLEGASIGDSDLLSSTLGTAVSSTFTADATYAQYDRLSGAWSSAITITNLAAGETVLLELIRDQGTDTYAQDIGFWAMEIKFTKTLAN